MLEACDRLAEVCEEVGDTKGQALALAVGALYFKSESEAMKEAVAKVGQGGWVGGWVSSSAVPADISDVHHLCMAIDAIAWLCMILATIA